MTPEQEIARNGWPEAAPEIMRILAAAGYAVVPVEPTERMREAAAEWWPDPEGCGEKDMDPLYQAMIAAAKADPA